MGTFHWDNQSTIGRLQIHNIFHYLDMDYSYMLLNLDYTMHPILALQIQSTLVAGQAWEWSAYLDKIPESSPKRDLLSRLDCICYLGFLSRFSHPGADLGWWLIESALLSEADWESIFRCRLCGF